jgi:hypothetical protein
MGPGTKTYILLEWDERAVRKAVRVESAASHLLTDPPTGSYSFGGKEQGTIPVTGHYSLLLWECSIWQMTAENQQQSGPGATFYILFDEEHRHFVVDHKEGKGCLVYWLGRA